MRSASRSAGTAHWRRSSGSSGPTAAGVAESTGLSGDDGSASTSVPPARVHSSSAVRCASPSVSSSRSVAPAGPGRVSSASGPTAWTRTRPPSPRSVSTSALVPDGPVDAGSSGGPSAGGGPSTMATTTAATTRPTHIKALRRRL
jgi:hypothetical protein